MARAPDERVSKAYELYKQGKKLVEIASQLNIPDGTVRRWKSTYKWDNERSEKKSERSDKSDKKKEAVASEVESVMSNDELNDKQRLFCLYFVKSFNATKAYQKAYGCNYETAASIAYRLLENDGVKTEIQRLKQGKLNKAYLSEHDIFQKYMDIAFADITDFLEFGREEIEVMGPFGPIEIKDEDTGKKTTLKKVVNTVRFKESYMVDGTIISEVKQGRDGASIKLADRMKALEWLASHMDMATEEQKARIALLKAKVNTDDTEQTEDDGFLEALEGKVDDIWQEE